MEWLLLVLVNIPVFLLLWRMVAPRRLLFAAILVIVLAAEHWLLLHELRLFEGP